ncbi:MAG: tripartite tricarboxylate transporter TctB family protein [Deltaproteobacteria bacterium]|nr:tripartite tricarboxylate transporter TctB family protein [Deltaproteobacteria bacterium]
MKKNIVIGLVTTAVSAACLVSLSTMKQGFAMEDNVSASFFPYVMVGLLGFLGVLQTINAFVDLLKAGKDPDKKAVKTDYGEFWKRYQVPLLMFILVAAYIFLIPVIGFYTMTAVFFLALGLLLGGPSLKNILKVSGAAAGTILFMYLVFEVSLRIYMPSGIFY